MKIKSNTIQINPFFIFCIVFLFACIIAKMTYVGLNSNIDGVDIRQIANSRSQVTEEIEATRGNILDTDGNMLAQNVNSYTIIAYLSSTRTTNPDNPKHVTDPVSESKSLSDILCPGNQECYNYILDRLSQSNLYQTELGTYGRNITETTKQKIEKLDLPGIDFEKTFKRYYQNGDFASYIIGYAKKYTDEKTGDMKLVGELGIEGYCDRYLKGTNGSITYQKDAYGYQMADKISYVKQAQNGYDIYLTLDKQVQIFIDDAITKLTEFDPAWVSITIADAKTGAIIGSASNPSFDPNKLNITDYNNPLTSYAYEPGSTMKIFSFMSAIEEGKYKGDEKYMSGNIKVDDYTISDWNKNGWGSITYDTGFTYSSNVAAVHLAQSVGRDKLHEYYQNLGFGSQTGIELANEYVGDISFEYASELASASYGQGITVTPIQMIQALTSITNDGTILKPYIIKKIVNHDTGKEEYVGKRTEVRKVYSTATVNKMIDLLDKTVNTTDPIATGKIYASDRVRIIGKTGTANYADTVDGGYVKGSNNVIKSFAGIFPKDNPEYIIYIATKDYQGRNSVFGRITKDLIESIAKYKNLEDRASDKDESKIITIPNLINKSVLTATSNLNSIGVNPIIIGDGATVIKQYPDENTKTSINSKVFVVTNGDNVVMPDITNWSSKDVVAFCDLVGIKYTLNGYGYVKSYSIPAGTTIDTTIDNNLEVNLESIKPESLVSEVTTNGT